MWSSLTTSPSGRCAAMSSGRGAGSTKRRRAGMQRMIATGTYAIFQHDGRDIGVLHFEREPGALWLAHLFILPEHQNLGIGTKLLRELKRGAAQTRKRRSRPHGAGRICSGGRQTSMCRPARAPAPRRCEAFWNDAALRRTPSRSAIWSCSPKRATSCRPSEASSGRRLSSRQCLRLRMRTVALASGGMTTPAVVGNCGPGPEFTALSGPPCG